MNKNFKVVTALLVLVLAAGVAQAGGPLFFDAQFNFYVGGKEFQAGKYEVQPQGQGMVNLSIRNTSGGDMMLLPIATRLADMGLREAQVVFDVANGKHYLSEIHIPGFDGFELSGAPGKHTHAKVTVTEGQ